MLKTKAELEQAVQRGASSIERLCLKIGELENKNKELSNTCAQVFLILNGMNNCTGQSWVFGVNSRNELVMCCTEFPCEDCQNRMLKLWEMAENYARSIGKPL